MRGPKAKHALKAAVFSWFGISCTAYDPPVETNRDELAFEHARARLGGIRADLQLLSAQTEHFPLSGQVLHRYVVHSRATGELETVDVDEAGRRLDDRAVREAERLARWERFGHLRPSFAERVEALSDDEQLWVVVYLPSETDVETHRARLLTALGPVEYVPASDGAPLLRVRVTAAQLRMLSRSELVGAVFDATERERELHTNADHYVLSRIDVAHGVYSLLGDGVRVGILGELVGPHENLPFDPYGPRAMHPAKSPCPDSCIQHGSQVTAFIQNTNPLDLEDPELTNTDGKKGTAPLAEIYNANAIEVVGTLIRSQDFTGVAGNGTHTWQKVAGSGIFSHPQVYQALPDNGTSYDTNAYTSAPRLDYTLDFPVTGRYYVWVRGKCTSSSCNNSDTVHVGLDGVVSPASDRVHVHTTGFGWRSASYGSADRPYVDVDTQGSHTVSVYMREDGFTFDALVLTPVSSFTPSETWEDPRHAFTRDTPTTAMDEYSWLASKGVLVVNQSAGGVCPSGGCEQGLREMVADYYATRPPYILSVFSGGNSVSSGEYGNVVSNFLYNGLVVGGAQPKCYTPPQPCTMGWQSTDRTLDHTSSNYVFQNPPDSTDWELPHMVGYARGLAPALEDGTETGGTSLAAPQVAGTAALIIGGNSNLVGRPETVKAILMAGADVNTDLNQSGASYSYVPKYNGLASGGGIDRRGGVGLLNAAASAEISLIQRNFGLDNRSGMSSTVALSSLPTAVRNYQLGVSPTQPALVVELAAGAHGGYDEGVMDPAVDFEGNNFKHQYFVTAAATGYLRIALTWNRPFTCSGNPVTCNTSDFPPNIGLFARDLNLPSNVLGSASTADPAEAFLVLPVLSGKTYRLEMTKKNTWTGPVRYGIAMYLTPNPQ